MTTANKITIFRILLVPFFIVQLLYHVKTGNEVFHLLAILSFGLAAISDGVDGFVARHYNQRSELGAVLDPLADKLLLVSAVVLLSLDNRPYFEQLPFWFSATILSRDVLLLLGLVVIHFVCGKATVRPRIVGKIATVTQMTTVLWALLQWSDEWLVFWSLAGALFTAASAILYVIDGVRQLAASPSSSASSSQ